MAARRAQRGALMLAMLVIAGLIAALFTAGLLTTRLTGTDAPSRERDTREALMRAKAALLAYAVTYAENHDPNTDLPGFLPCPDTSAVTRDGVADAPCGAVNVNVMGRLPWYTLDIPPLRDAAGECLWYAVAGRYKASTSKTNDFTAADQSTQSGLFNWDTPGQLLVYGPDGSVGFNTGYDRAVAVVLAPGLAQGTQTRASVAGTTDCGGNYTAANYLDTRSGVNVNNALIASTPPAAGATSFFVQGPEAPGFNDQLVVITSRELWAAIWRSRVFQAKAADLARKVAECIAAYGSPTDERLPTASPMDSFVGVASLYNSANYNDGSNIFGRVPFNTLDSNAKTGKTQARLLGRLVYDGNANLIAGESGTCATWSAQTNLWYANYKDQLFYAVSGPFLPTNSAGALACGASDCITLNGNKLAALVIFSGPPLGGQTRAGTSQVQDALNYLEEPNLAASQVPGNNGAFVNSSPGTALFNDTIACGINDSLAIPTLTCPQP